MLKKIIFLKTYPDKIGGAEISLKILKDEFTRMNIDSSIKRLKAPNFLSSWTKALVFNYQTKKNKKKDEFYISYERIEASDIYICGEGVHKDYAKTKNLWFTNPLNFIYPYLEKKCILNSKKTIAVSNLVKNQLINAYNVDKNRIEVIYNPIEIAPDFDKKEAKINLCKEFNFQENLPIFLFVGSGYKRKGVKEFLQILSKLSFEFNSIVIGKDKNLQYYKALAKKLNTNTLFLGQRKDVYRFYQASDIFLFPTHFEPFGNTVLESMNFKNIAITTAQAGSSELLKDEFIMRDPNDLSIVNTIENLVKNRAKMSKIGQENREISLEFSASNQAQKVFNLIKEYL